MAKAISDQLNKEYSDYKAAFKYYQTEKTEYESEQDYGAGKLLMPNATTGTSLVYNLGDADRLYNWDAGLVKIPRSEIDGAVWDDSVLGEDERSYNGIRDTYYVDANGEEVAAPAEGDALPAGTTQTIEPGIAGQEVRLTQWYFVPVTSDGIADWDEVDASDELSAEAKQAVKIQKLLDRAVETGMISKVEYEALNLSTDVELSAFEAMDDAAKAEGLPSKGHVVATSPAEADTTNLYRTVEGLWIRNTFFGADRHTGNVVTEATEESPATYEPRTTGAWQVEGEQGVIAVLTSDGTVERTVEGVDADGNPTFTTETYVDESLVGTYRFDQLPAAFSSQDGNHYLASYRVEMGDGFYDDFDTDTVTDDEQWLISRYHKTAKEGYEASDDSDLNAGNAQEAAPKAVSAGAMAFTAQDEVVSVSQIAAFRTEYLKWRAECAKIQSEYEEAHAKWEEDPSAFDAEPVLGEMPPEPTSSVTQKGVRAHSGHIILAREAVDETGAPTNAETNDLNRNDARVTVPLADVITENALADGTASAANVRDVLVTYDYLTPRTRTELAQDENGQLKETQVQKVHGGDAGEIRPSVQQISGIVFNDTDNDGLRTSDDTDPLMEGIQVSLERYYMVVGEEEAGWQADPLWATDDEYAAYEADPSTGLGFDSTTGAFTASYDGGDRTVLTDEDGTYTFTGLRTQGWMAFDADGNVVDEREEEVVDPDFPGIVRPETTPKRVVFAYRARLTEPDWWNRYYGSAKYLQGGSYALGSVDFQADSDLVHSDGYLMAYDADGVAHEFDVLLNVVEADSPNRNYGDVANANNANQNSDDRYGHDQAGAQMPYLSDTDVYSKKQSDVAAAGTTREAVTYHEVIDYDLARGADRAGNDAGLRMPVAEQIGGRLWHDANYDGIDNTQVESTSDAGMTVSGMEEGLANKKVMLKQWYYAPVTVGEGEDAVTTWQWIQNTAFGTTEDIYVRAGENVDDDHPVANAGTLVIPGATAENGYVYLHTDDAALTVVDGVNLYTSLGGNYLFENLPTRYVEPRHGAIDGVEGDEDAGIEPVAPVASNLGAPANEYLAGYTLEVLGGSAADAKGETIYGLPASLWQMGSVASDSVNSKAVSEEAARGNTALNFTDYADGTYPIRWTELTVQQMADPSVTEVTANEEPATAKSTLDGKIILAARATNEAAAGTLDAAGNAEAKGTQGQYYVSETRDGAAAGSANAVVGTMAGEVNAADADQTVYYDFSRGHDELRMHGGFGEYGYTTISGKIWRDKNFDGILNPGEEVLGGKTLSITQWFYTADAELIDALEAAVDGNGDAIFEIDRVQNVIVRTAAGEPEVTEDGAWVRVIGAGADSTVSTFSRPKSTTTMTPVAGQSAGTYEFTQLPSFVYLVGDGSEEHPFKILQPNDTSINAAGEAYPASVDKLFMAGYRLTMEEVAPDFSLTTAHVGVNYTQKHFNDLATLNTATGGKAPENSDSDAVRDPDGKLIQIMPEFFDNTYVKDGAGNLILSTDDPRDGSAASAANWRMDGYVIVSEREVTNPTFTYQYKQVYNTVSYDVPRPMGDQRGGDAGLVYVPRTSLTGTVWDDNGILDETTGTYDYTTGYNGIFDEGERGLAGQKLTITQWYWVPAPTEEDANAGEWVRNTAFGADRYTSTKELVSDEADAKPYIYDGNAAAPKTPLAVVEGMDGVLEVTTNQDGNYLVENLPTVYVTDNDQYYLAAYRLELVDLYHEDAVNGVDGSDNYWVPTRYHNSSDAARTANENVAAADVTAVNNSWSVKADSDIASALKTDGENGTTGGIVVASRVVEEGDGSDADTTADELAAGNIGSASDATNAGGVQTTRNNNGQIILAHRVDAGDTQNQDAYVTLTAGEGMGAGVETYDWIRNPDGIVTDTEGDNLGLDSGTAVPVQAGDIGQVRTPLASVTGMVFGDTDNDGIRAYVDLNGNGIHDENDKDHGYEGLRIAIERYTVDAAEQADGSFAVASDAQWTRDETWATNWNAYDIDPVANPLVNDDLGLSREVTSAADGSFSFDNLPAYQRTVAEDGTQTITLYGYRLRVVDYRFWDKFLGVAKYQEGNDYKVDSDVVAATGYLMEDGQYDVLLNVITNESPVTNHLVALGSKNENQNDVDLYGLGDGSGKHGFTPPASAKTAETLTYDLGLGANRASNDAGVRMPPKAQIAGRLFNDATYDGLDRATDAENATVTLDPGYNNKMVLLRQWYWVPSGSGDGTGQWRLNESFGNELYTRAFANTDAVNAPDALVIGTTNDTYYDANLHGVWTTTASLEQDGMTVDGYYCFNNLPTRYVMAHTTGSEADGVVTPSTMGKEYLAGYTLEVLGQGVAATGGAAALPDEKSMNGMPATRLQVNADGKMTSTYDVDTDAVNSKVDVAWGQADHSVYQDGNYPLRWNDFTTQVTLAGADGAEGFTKATLDGRIVLAAQAQTESDPTGATHPSNRVQAKGHATADSEEATVAVDFDFSAANDELRMNAGFGLFGTTDISGRVWEDKNYNGVFDVTETGLAGKSLTLTQWYYVSGRDNEQGAFVADGTQLMASTKISKVRDASGTVVGAWVQVPARDDAAKTGFAPITAATAETDATAGTVAGDYAFTGLPSFVYVEQGQGAGAQVYQPGDKPDTTPLENQDAVTTDRLYLVSYRLVLSEIAPDFSLTVAHVGINVDSSVEAGTTGTTYSTAVNADGTHTTTSNRTETVATRPGSAAGQTGVTNGSNREDIDSDAVRVPENPSGPGTIIDTDDATWTERPGSIVLREEFFDGVATAWRTDSFVLTSNHAVAGDGHRYQQTYGQGASGTVDYDVPNPMGTQRGGNAGLFRAPTASIEGVVWDDATLGHSDPKTYDGLRDETEVGIADQLIYITQWYYDPIHTNPEDNNSHWFQNKKFGSDRYTSNRDSAARAAGDPVVPLAANGNTGLPLEYHEDYADNGALVTTTGAIQYDVDGTTVLDNSQLGRYRIDNLPTVYVSEFDMPYLAAYRLELADVNHTEDVDGFDNEWLLTRYHVAGDDNAALQANRGKDSDVYDVYDQAERGVAGGIMIKGSYYNNAAPAAGTMQTRANDGQVILASITNLSGANAAAAQGSSRAIVTVEAGSAMDSTDEVIYDWTAADAAVFAGGDVGELQGALQSITGKLWFDDDTDGVDVADEDNGIQDWVDADGDGLNDDPTADEKPAVGMDVTLERYFYVSGSGQTTWLRDDEWAANADTLAGGAEKSQWATEAEWAAYDANPTVGLAWNDAAGAYEQGPAMVDRTVKTDQYGQYTFAGLKSQEVVKGVDENGDEKRFIVIYAYKARVTNLDWWNRYYGTAKLKQGDDRMVDSDLVYDNGYLMADDEYDVLLRPKSGADQPPSNCWSAPSPNNPNNDAANGADGSLPTYDLALGLSPSGNDGGLRAPKLQKISGVLWHDADYDGIQDMGEMGLAGKRVVLKQWYFDDEAGIWKQNTLFGTAADAYTHATHTMAADGTITPLTVANSTVKPTEGNLADPATAGVQIAGSVSDGQGGIWVHTNDGVADVPGLSDINSYKERGRYIFTNLPTRYASPLVPGTDGQPAQPGKEYLAGYTVEVYGGNDADAMQGMPTTLYQQKSPASDALNSQALTAQKTLYAGTGAQVSASAIAGGTALAPYTDNNYPIRWNEATVQAEYQASIPFGSATYTKYNAHNFVILAGDVVSNSDNRYVAKVDNANVYLQGTPGFDGEDANFLAQFDWTRGRDEGHLDGGFGQFGTSAIAGLLFQDKDVNGWYDPADPSTATQQELDDADVPLTGRRLQVEQWFFVPDVQDADGTYVTNPLLASLRAAGYVETADINTTEIDTFTDGAGERGGVWVKSKSFTYFDDLTDPSNTKTGTETFVSAPNADVNYLFTELPTFVYVDTIVPDGQTTAVLRDVQPYFGDGNQHVLTSATEAAQVTSDVLFMASYRITVDDVEPDYAIAFPHYGANVDPADAPSDASDDPTTHNRDTDSDAVRGSGNYVNVAEEMKGEGLDGTDRMDGYIILSAETPDTHGTTAAGQYQIDDIMNGATGAVFYNGKYYDVPRPATMAQDGVFKVEVEQADGTKTTVVAQRGGDVGLVPVKKATITGRVWEDNNYDGLQATKLDDEGNTVLDEEAEPGIPDQAVNITQWYWTPFDADDPNYDSSNPEAGEWRQNLNFGTDRYTTDLTGTNPAIPGGVALGDGIVQVKTSAGTLGVDGVTLEGAGVYTFDELSAVAVIQASVDSTGKIVADPNGDRDSYFLAAYRVQLVKTNDTESDDVDGTQRTDHWLLTRYQTGHDDADEAEANKALNSDVVDELAFATGGTTAGRNTLAIVAQNPDATQADGSGSKSSHRQLEGQIVLAQMIAADAATNSGVRVIGASNTFDASDSIRYDWMAIEGEVAGAGRVDFYGGDIGEIKPTLQTVSGILWNDEDNDGVRDAGEPLRGGVKVSLERYYSVLDDANATWTWDSAWADNPAGYRDGYTSATNSTVPGVGTVAGGVITDNEWANTVTGAAGDPDEGVYTFEGLRSHDTRYFDAAGNEVAAGTAGATAKLVVYGYKVRVTDEAFRSRNLVTSTLKTTLNGTTYTTDSDLVHDSGYLMGENEYTVLVNVFDDADYVSDATDDIYKVSQPSNVPSNVHGGLYGYNPNQNDADIYGRMPAASTDASVDANAVANPNRGVTDVAWAGGSDRPVRVLYDLAKPANREHNDGGLMDIVTKRISGYVWADANYDGLVGTDEERLPLYGVTDTVSFSIDGRSYSERGLVGKTVTLKQWYFVPGADAATEGTWHQLADVADTEENPGKAYTLTFDTVAAATAVESGRDHADGYYEFNDLPVYVAVDGVEYLAGYTVEVKGGTGADAVNFPVTKAEQPLATDGASYNSEAQAIGTTLAPADASKVTVANTAADGRLHDATNYPLAWKASTGQAQAAAGAGQVAGTNQSASTLDNFIVLAGNKVDDTLGDTQPTTQGTYERAFTRNGASVAFDLTSGRDEDELSAGFGYFGTATVSGQVWTDGNFDGLVGTSADDAPVANQTVHLTQWYYLAGTASADGATFNAAAITRDGVQLRAAATYTTADDIFELVKDAAGNVVGAWIQNPAFGEKTYEADGETLAKDAQGRQLYTGTKVTATDAGGEYSFGELLPFVQFSKGDGEPLSASDAAGKATDDSEGFAANDALALAAYRVTLPQLPEGMVLTVYHSSDAANTGMNDSDAKRDVNRTNAANGQLVTGYPQFTGTGEQPDGALAQDSGFIVVANSSTAATAVYADSKASVDYDVAYQVDRTNVNTGLYRVPASTITGWVWDDSAKDNNVAPDGIRDTGLTTDEDGNLRQAEPGIADQVVITTQWYFVPNTAAYASAFAQISSKVFADNPGNANAGTVEWVLADGSTTTVKPGSMADVQGAWVQNSTFGSDWLSTAKNLMLGQPSNALAVVTGSVAPDDRVRVPQVSGGVSVTDAAGRASAVAVVTEKAATRADGTVDETNMGRYVFDNLPTAVVRTNEATGEDQYFLAAYRVELKDVKHTKNLRDGSDDPWHLTPAHAGTGTYKGKDAWTVDSDTDVDAKGTGSIKDAYTVETRYSNAVSPLRANKGQVILAGTTAPDGAPVTPLAQSTSSVPAGSAMDSTAAATYHWTNPQAAAGGDVGEVKPAYGIISGYVWSDNKYKDGAYNTLGGDYVDDDGNPQEYDPEQGYYTDPNTSTVAKTVYLRQWYFDPEAVNAAGTKGDWLPTVKGGYSSVDDASTGTYSYSRTATVGKNAAVASGTAHEDGYFEFTNLPVRVIVDGKEYLAGYTTMVVGDAISLTTFEEVHTTQDDTRFDPEIDAWNSKARGIVSNASDAKLVNRYGAGNFPLYRSSHVAADGTLTDHIETGADGKDVAIPLSNSDGKTHAIDGVIVLAGSTTVDATGNKPAAGSYNVGTDAFHRAVEFNLTYAKNETHMNGGIIEPPSAPIVGLIWEDADYDGIRSDTEEGIAGVEIQVIPYYYTKVGTYADGTDKWSWVRAVEYEAQLEDLGLNKCYTMDGTDGTIKGRYVTANMPTKFRFDADGNFVPATDDREGEDYLAGYRIVVTKMPVKGGVTATLTRNHAAGTDHSLLGVESDLFRSADGATTNFVMKNRDFVSVIGPDGNPTEAVKDGGMVIVAHSVTGNVAEEYRKEYFGNKGNSIVYDISTNVPQRNGGDAGLVFIPYTSIEGDVWDDTYQAEAGDVLSLAAKARAYNGIRDTWLDADGNEQTEPGLADRTMMITQWKYTPAGANGASGTWEQVKGFGTKTTLTADGTKGTELGHYAFNRLPSAVISNTKNTYDVVREIDTYERQADGSLVMKDTLGNTGPQQFWSDKYWLTSYQVEISGFDATTTDGDNDKGALDGLWMLTRYHEGTGKDKESADSDVRTDERIGVAGGRPLRDQDTLAGQDGVRAGSPDAAVGSTGTGARIVVASVGDNDAGDTKTNLKYTSDYVNVAASQLLYNEATGAAATGTVGYDWLTVPFSVSTTGTGEDAVTTKTKTPLAGGNVGLVHPGTQSIEGILWYDEDNDGVQDADEEGLNSYRVDIERYFYNEKKGAWERMADWRYLESEASLASGTATHKQNLSEVPGGSDYDYWRTGGNLGMPSELDLKCGQTLGATGTMQDGYYRFADLDTMGLVYLDAAGNIDPAGTQTKVVYGYKVKVTDRRVVSGQLLKSKLNVKGADLDYTTDSDLQRNSYLTAANEYIVLLEQVDVNGMTPDGKVANVSNIAWAPASNNADQTATLTDPMTSAAHPGLVAYDYMASDDRAHNDGGLIRLPKFSISGYVWADEDYDGLFQWYPQDRLDDNGAVVETNYVEAGYNGKRVYLKKWYYDPEAVNEDGTKGAWLAWENTADAIRENGPAAQNMLTGTNPAQVYGTAQDEDGNDYDLTYDVDGYYEFTQLPTAYAKVDAAGNYTYYLAGYTVELNGANSADGMVSLLVTSHQWATTAKDAVNSKAQPMLTEEGQQNGWEDYTAGNYPIQWDEENLQTGSGRHVNNKPAGYPRDGVSKNIMDGKIVLAGIADNDTYENQKLTATRGTGASQVKLNFDFAFGQKQTAMNAGFAPPDHTNLTGKVWLDEDFDGSQVKLNFDFAFGQKQTAMNAGFAPPDHTNLTGKVWLDEDFDGLFTDDNPIDDVTVVLTQFYFVPNLDTSGTHQLYEDLEGNLFYWETDEDTGERSLRLEKAAPTTSVLAGNDGTVYYVRADRVYSYEKLLELGTLPKLSESGTWVENTNLVGNGETVVMGVNGHGQDVVLDADGNPMYGVDVKLDDNGVPVDELERVQLNADGTIRTHTLGAHQIVVKTDEGGDYNFYDLPSYVLVDSAVTDPAHPGADISKVYQPRTDYNKVFAGYQTDENGEFVLDENGHKIPLYTNGFASWKTDENGEYVLDDDGNKIPVYDDEVSFGTANHYLVGYAVRVINPDGKYMASRYHVDAPEGSIDSDLHSFDANMSGKYNEDGTMEETYAVVAQQSKSGEKFANDSYEVEYKGIVYDLANRLYLKHAGNAGLILQHPVYLSGRVWDDVDADGLQGDEESEPGIKGALVRLTRYWYDTTGIGSLESAPSDAWDDIPSVDDTELSQEVLDFIINMDEDDPEAMIAWINAVAEGDEGEGDAGTTPGTPGSGEGEGTDPTDPDAPETPEAPKPEGKPLRTYEELKAFERAHYFFIYGYGELLDKPDGSGQIVIEHPGNEAVENALITMMFRLAEGNEFDEDEKNVWRRDWSFSQSDVAVLAEEGGMGGGGLTSVPSQAELDALVGGEVPLVSVRQDADGTVNIPGSVFNYTVYNGDWAFLASGTGLHQVKGSGASFKVLYGYRVEIISYPDEDVYEPTVQNVGEDDHINSNYDMATDSLRPNDFDVTLSHTTEEMGDLIILTTLAQPDEGMSTAGPYEEYKNMEVADELLEGSGILDDLMHNNGIISGGASTVAAKVAAAADSERPVATAAAGVALFAAVRTAVAAAAGNPMPAFGTSVSTFAEGDGAGEGSVEGEGGTEPAEPVEPGTQNVADMTEAEKVAEAEALGAPR